MGRICEYCEKAFIPKRSDAIYCSQSCKQMSYLARKIKAALITPDIKDEENSLQGMAGCNPCRESSLEMCFNTEDFFVAEEIEKDNNVEMYPKALELTAVLKNYNLEESGILDELKKQILLTCLKLQEVSFKKLEIFFFYEEFLKVVEEYLLFIVEQRVTRKQLNKIRSTLELLTDWKFCMYLTPELLSDIYIMKTYTSYLVELIEKEESMPFISQREEKIILITYRYLLETYLSKNKLYSTNNKADEQIKNL